MKKFFDQKIQIKVKDKKNLIMKTDRNGEFQDYIISRKVLFEVIKVMSTLYLSSFW